MKKFFLSAAAFLGLATSAYADATVIVCRVELKTGTEVAYALQRTSDNTFAEVFVERNGNRLTHAPYSRPRWYIENIGEQYVGISYGPDTRYQLVMANDVRLDSDGTGVTKTIMMLSDKPIGIGVCMGSFR